MKIQIKIQNDRYETVKSIPLSGDCIHLVPQVGDQITEDGVNSWKVTERMFRYGQDEITVTLKY
jgi:hypothetical protein